MEEKILLTPEQAKEVLSVHNGKVHTFLNGGGMLIGADHDKESIYESIDNADILEVTGPSAQAMGHGLGIFRKGAKNQGDILFVETNMELLKKYDASLGLGEQHE